MGKLTVQAIYGKGKIEQPAVLAWFGDFNFLYFSGVLFVVSVAVIIVVSLLTPPPPQEKLRGLTYASVTPEDRAELRASWNRIDIMLTALVIGLVLAVYLYFSFWI